MMYLRPGEVPFVPMVSLSLLTIVGSSAEALVRVQWLADAAVDNLALQASPGMARELIEEFDNHAIPKL
jgi:hypothetical protein